MAAAKVGLFLAAFIVVSISSDVNAATINAMTCSRSDVGAAIASAVDGDTVQVPRGTCSWTSTLIVTKAVKLIGAGIDQTIIQDDVPRSSANHGILIEFNVSGKPWRLSGMTLSPGSVTAINPDTVVYAHGSSRAFRIDNVKFNDLYASRFVWFVEDLWGVMDHCVFLMSSRNGFPFSVNHSGWGGLGIAGDNSWATPSNYGTEQFIFVEDNTFTATGVVRGTDADAGARFVFRNNTLNNVVIASHGTESTGRVRGVRLYEIYNNTFTVAGQSPAYGIDLRSGTGVIYGNVFSGFEGQKAVAGSNFRDRDSFAPWGTADGSSPYDRNDNMIYETGTHTGSNGVYGVLTDSTKSWTAGKWVGGSYSIRNMTQGWGSYITANTATTISAQGSAYNGPRTWNTGDVYQILRAYPALDQIGRGPGALLNGAIPTPAAWPNQALEPLYVWGNTLNGGTVEGTTPHVQVGRDIISGTPKPGYAPFTYPHPLVSGSSGSTSSSAGTSTPPTLLPAPSNLIVH